MTGPIDEILLLPKQEERYPSAHFKRPLPEVRQWLAKQHKEEATVGIQDGEEEASIKQVEKIFTMAVGQPQLLHNPRQYFVSLCIYYIILDLEGNTKSPTPEAVERYKAKAKKGLKDLPSEIWMSIKKERGETRLMLPCLETLQKDAWHFFKETGAEDRLFILRLRDPERPVLANNTQQGQEPVEEEADVDADFIVLLAVWLSKTRIWPDFGVQEVTRAMLREVIGKAESHLGFPCSFTVHSSAGEADRVIT